MCVCISPAVLVALLGTRNRFGVGSTGAVLLCGGAQFIQLMGSNVLAVEPLNTDSSREQGGEEPGMDFSFVDLQCYAHFIQNLLYAGRASVNHGGRTIFFYGFQPIVRNGIKLENSGRGKINNKCVRVRMHLEVTFHPSSMSIL